MENWSLILSIFKTSLLLAKVYAVKTLFGVFIALDEFPDPKSKAYA